MKIVEVFSKEHGLFLVGDWKYNRDEFGKVTEIVEIEADTEEYPHEGKGWLIPRLSTFVVKFEDDIHSIELFDVTSSVREK